MSAEVERQTTADHAHHGMPRSLVETAGLATDAALRACLDGVGTVKGACAAVVQLLAAHPGLLPSIFLERGGRLRCQAVSGYWQVFDGIPPNAGVVGRTFASGKPAVIPNTSGLDGYLEAVPAVRSEVCVPIHLGERVIGALNVESERELSDTLVPALERCAMFLAEHIGQLGGIPEETRSERLARHAVALSGLVEREAILARVVEAASDVAEMQSVAIGLAAPGGLHMAAAEGTHSAALRALTPEELREVSDWVRATTSVHTIGEPAGSGAPGHEALRRAGAEALIALPLVAGTGFLLLVDSAPVALETEDIELLELLAAHATSALATATALGDLRERAATDPLTGLGHHASFHAALEEACARPERRGSLALLVFDLDGFKRVNDTRGHQAGDHLLRQAATSLREALRAGEIVYRIGGDEFAALVTVVTPEEAMAAASRLRRVVNERIGAGVSVGVALHTAPEDPAAFFARADAALYEAKRAGGNRAALDSRG
jgi:diguanylate cyclase (GGDEF)-like protein